MHDSLYNSDKKPGDQHSHDLARTMHTSSSSQKPAKDINKSLVIVRNRLRTISDSV